jgi:hypothetical protein
MDHHPANDTSVCEEHDILEQRLIIGFIYIHKVVLVTDASYI